MTDADTDQKVNFKELIKRRGTIKGRLTKFIDYLSTIQKIKASDITSLQTKELSLRLSKFQDLFKTFDELQSEIESICSDVDEQLDERESTERQFYSALSVAQELIEATPSTINKANSVDQQSNCSHQQSNCSHAFNGIKLPTIHLPKFDGNMLTWLEFKDTFDSIINCNNSIPEINKFHYLRSALEGSARGVIKAIEFTSSNYKLAWELLCERYDNKNVLINNHLKSLVTVERCSKESYKALRYLVDHMSKNLRALDTLGQPTDKWDALVIFIIASKLDSVTYTKWEEYRATLTDYHKLENFTMFLRNRADILETMHFANMVHTDKGDRRSNYPRESKVNKAFVASSEHGASAKCYICPDDHQLHGCPKFKNMSIEDRLSEISRLKLCKNCLKSGHNSFQCKSRPMCRVCKKKHNSLIHKNEPIVSNAIQDSTEVSNLPVSLSVAAAGQVLLGTAIVDIVNRQTGEIYQARALLDTGSQMSFITSVMKERLNLVSDKSRSIHVAGINNSISNISERVKVEIKSRISEFCIPIDCLVVPNIIGTLPNVQVNVQQLAIPKEFRLADPTFYKPSQIDILIGADVYWSIVNANHIYLGKNKPALQDTKLGWLVSGPTGQDRLKSLKVTCSFSQELQDDLKRFWEIEESYSEQFARSPDEHFCERHFVETTKRLANGRFSVLMPLKEEPKCALGDSYAMAKKRLLNLETRLDKNPELKDAYSKFINEYKELGHLTEIARPQFGVYLPHHCIIKEHHETTKVRVVFDASAKTTSGKSLNDIQAVGPVIQSDLLSILLRFREHRFVLTGDIAKMYRMIAIDESQRHLQLILWRCEKTHNIVVYQLNTVTYGTASAPFLSTRCLQQLALECGDEIIKETMLTDFYIDDLSTGCASANQLTHIFKSITRVLESAGFILRKFRTNCPQIFEHEQVNSDTLELCKESAVLGLNWSPVNDSIQFSTNVPLASQITKRTIISMTCKIFDPLGLLSAAIIKPKILLQRLWCAKLQWDEPIPKELAKDWLNFSNNLSYLYNIHLPRYVLCEGPEYIELHCFVDASQAAFGACIYLRSRDSKHKHTSRLLCAKARVAPIKPLTIPRLELCGALLGARLCQKVSESLKCKINKKIIWTDSTVVLGWLKMQPSLLKTFVRNRVNEIQELTADYQWFHVPTSLNPADMASRGVDPQVLNSSTLWWEGPPFLKQEDCEWPTKLSPPEEATLPEVKALTSYTFAVNSKENLVNKVVEFSRFSNFLRLKRTIAYVLRFINNCKGQRNSSQALSVEELQKAGTLLIKLSQFETFYEEIETLSKGHQLHKRSKLLALNPFVDTEKVLRVGGRLGNSSFDYNKKHPVLLDAKHSVTKLLMKHEHLRLFHAGPQALLAAIREEYWPIGGRNLARITTKQCVVCTRLRGKSVEPIMGDLPAVRTDCSFAFSSCGVDFAGPFRISSRKGRGNRITKSYLCLFVCLTTKAVHLEVVSDLTSEAFILCIRRFVARRGKPYAIYCDNGRNFIGACNELGRMLQKSQDSVFNYSANEGIRFVFGPAYSPHFGGIWEAGIKSSKYHLKRVAGEACLTFEELATLFSQIEAILNSRPLSPLSSDPNDPTPLTPGHFLVGRPLTAVPSPPITALRPNRYELIEKIRQQFWSRWQKEFLAEMQQRSRWRTQQQGLNCGDLVLLREANLPPLQWRLGRVTRLHPGPDGVSRVADVTTTKGTVTRAVRTMCPLFRDTSS